MRVELSEELFPFTSGLATESRHQLRALAPRQVDGGQLLLRRGDEVEGAYLVLEGALRVFYVASSGREATLYDVEPGGTCILANTAAIEDQPYPAWVEARAGGAVFVCIDRAVLRSFLAREAAFRDFVFGALSGRVFELMMRLEEVGSEQLEQRIARFLLRRAGENGVVCCSQSGIASELGTAREVVFRVLRSLGAQGMIEAARTRIAIRDRESLRRIARPAG